MAVERKQTFNFVQKIAGKSQIYITDINFSHPKETNKTKDGKKWEKAR